MPRMRESMKSYRELMTIHSFQDRLRYLQQAQLVGDRTFGGDRYLNQAFYKSREWRHFRHSIVVRDDGCDLAVPGYPVGDRGYIHHINPITQDQLIHGDDALFDPDNVILCSFKTHNAIHYGSELSIPQPLVERRPNDTCPWL